MRIFFKSLFLIIFLQSYSYGACDFKVNFGEASILYVMEITMTGNFTNNITQIALST